MSTKEREGLVRNLPKEWILILSSNNWYETSRVKEMHSVTKKWTTTQIALVVRTYPDYKDYPDASPEHQHPETKLKNQSYQKIVTVDNHQRELPPAAVHNQNL